MNEQKNEFVKMLDKAFYMTGNIGYRNLKNIIVHPEWFPFLSVENEIDKTDSKGWNGKRT